MRFLTLTLTAALLAGCAQPVTKTPHAVGGSRADATVEMAYDYFWTDQITVDWTGALKTATSRCKAWGYSRAEPFAGLSDRCEQYGSGYMAGTCMRGTVLREYQCLD